MASIPPKTTKAWTYTKGGLPRQALHLTTTHPLPIFPHLPPNPTNKQQQQQEEEWILVRVSYAALNQGEVILMNLLPSIMRGSASLPKVPGYDLVGEVLDVSPPLKSPEAGDGASSGTAERTYMFKKGDKIIAFLTAAHFMATRSGALQQHVALPARYAVPLPSSIAHSSISSSSFSPASTSGGEEGSIERRAAGLLLTGCTALQQVRDSGLKKDDRVLVYGASGGIGSMAVQLAREVVGPQGRVVGVCSGRNVRAVQRLGADEVVDYETGAVYLGEGGQKGVDNGRDDRSGAKERRRDGKGEEFRIENGLVELYHGADKKFDAVLDCFGSQEIYKRCAWFLKEGGVYSAVGIHASGYGFGPVLRVGLVLMLNALWPRSTWLGGTGRTWKAASMFDPGREMMEYLVALFGEGKLGVLVDSEWDFEHVLEGYDVLVSRRARGKIIIRVREDGKDDVE